MNTLQGAAEVTMSYRSNVKPSDRAKITNSKESEKIFRAMVGNEIEYRECFMVMYLNRGNKVLGVSVISQGGISGTVADPKIIFQGALLANASGMIVSHNHPSGNLTASASDINLTRKLKEGGRILEIEVLDHIILSPEEGKYLSMADEGLF